MAFSVINVIDFITDEATALLAANDCTVRSANLGDMSEAERCSQLRDVDAVVAGNEPWTESVFNATEKLKIVARSGAGYDQVDLDAATRHGVWVTNTPDATSNAVAEITIALILCLLRGIPVMLNDMKAGRWKRIQGKELGSMTIGIVGTGHIGREVIKRASSFGSKVLACDIAPDQAFAAKYQAQYVALEALLSQSDIVTLHCALNDQTRGLISERTLNLMKRSAYLINTSRPAVIVKEDLTQTLSSKRIAGAAIDVHDPKPEPDDPLIQLENVIATPWIASNTDISCDAMVTTAVQEIVRVLQGGEPRFALNRA